MAQTLREAVEALSKEAAADGEYMVWTCSGLAQRLADLLSLPDAMPTEQSSQTSPRLQQPPQQVKPTAVSGSGARILNTHHPVTAWRFDQREVVQPSSSVVRTS